MKVTMEPAEIERYRRAKITLYTMTQRYCAACKRRRSAGQFDKNAKHCRQCVLRGAK